MDAITIEKARRGDRDAQAALLQAMQDPWYRMALSLLGNPDRARDATQETAVRFLAQLRNFRGDSQLRTWAYGIALNVVREMRRKTVWQLPEDGPLDNPAPDPGPDESASHSEQRTLLLDLLKDLPDRQREAITLRFFEELSVDDAARAMNCAPGTVKATVHQALRSLKEKLVRLKL